MALKSINGGGNRKFITPDESFGTTSMEVGPDYTIKGYLLAIDSYTDKDGLLKTPLYILKPDEQVLRLYPSGNIKYAIEDGKLHLGQYIEIERLSDVKVKGRTSSKFDIRQDDENTIDLEATLAPIYKRSAEAFAAKKETEKASSGGGVVTKGMSKNEKSRAGIAAKAKLID